MTCTYRESKLPNGMTTVIIENEFIEAEVLPGKGADIYALRYKPRNRLDVLWKPPWSPIAPGQSLHRGNSEHKWMDHYSGGWQVMFPNAGEECRYKGAYHGFHGEASAIPWQWTILQSNLSEIAIRLETTLVRSPFRISRTLTLRSNSTELRLEEEIVNDGGEEMAFVWGQHIAFGSPFLGEGVVLEMPAKQIRSDRHNGEGGQRLPSASQQSWPLIQTETGDPLDYRILPSEAQRHSDMAFVSELAEGRYALYNPALHLGVQVNWDLETYPYVWLWQEFRGSQGYPFYGRCYVMGVEPCSTPIGSGLADSVEQGFAHVLQPGASWSTKLTVSFYENAASE